MSYIGTTDYFTEVSKGNVAGSRMFGAIGERESMGTTVTGEDVWRGSATTIPTPPDVGEQMSVVSDDAQDTAAGTGVRTVMIHYLDAAGDEQSEVVAMNGTTPVNTAATNIRFVQDMYTMTVGSNGVAEGDIEIYQLGSATTIYNMIAEGGNKSLVPVRMVPAGKTLHLQGWHVSEAQGRRVNLRIRSTDMYGDLVPGVFCFKDATYLNGTSSGELALPVKVPALSIVKVSGWPDASGAEASCSWWGVLVDD